MSASAREGLSGPRFNLYAQRGEARLQLRAPVRLELGWLHTLEVAAGELGSTLDLRQGALALRSRRTHALQAHAVLDVAAIEAALRAAGVNVTLHAGQSAVTRDHSVRFGATLSTEHGPVDFAVTAQVERGALELTLEGFWSITPRAAWVETVRECLRPLDLAPWGAALPLRMLVAGDGTQLRVVVDDAIAALLVGALLAAGWRLPRTRGLRGRVGWTAPTARTGATLALTVGLTEHPLGQPRDDGPGERGARNALDEAREALGRVLEQAVHAPVRVREASERLDAYLALEPAPVMRAEALLTLADVFAGAELGPADDADDVAADAGDARVRDPLVTSLCVRALACAGQSPDVARRVLTLAQRMAEPPQGEPLLAAVLAASLPAAQQAALVLKAVPGLAQHAAPRARAWLERVRPFATDDAALRRAEAALVAVEAAQGGPLTSPASDAQLTERTAEALAADRPPEEAAEAFARAARAYQQARDAGAAARCWVACVTSVPPHALDLEWVVPGASALQLAGRTQDALALLGSLLARDVGVSQRDVLLHALESAVRFHEALPAPLACPELFRARRQELLARHI